jgi:hypothetical protein
VAHGLNANTQKAMTFTPGKRANKHQKALWPVRRRSLMTGTRNRKRKIADIIMKIGKLKSDLRSHASVITLLHT